MAAQGFGVRKLGAPEQVDGKTLFEVASNSKAFTAAALAMLVDEGKLAWDDPVTKHLPDFQMYDAYVTHEMTVRDLLTHRSGLGLGAGDLLWWPTTNFIDRRDHPQAALHRAQHQLPQQLRLRQPAVHRGRQDHRREVRQDAGARRSASASWRRSAWPPPRPAWPRTRATRTCANAHSKINDKIAAVKAMPVPNAVGAVGINTNAEDIARWMNVLLAGGTLAHGADGKEARLFSAKQAREMWTAQTPMRISEPDPKLAAHAAELPRLRPGLPAARLPRPQAGRMHSGALQGFYSKVVLVPEAKLGIAILTNAESGGSLNALQYQLLDRMLDPAATTDWIGAVKAVEDERHAKELARLAKASAARAAKSQPSLARAAYDGDYQDPWYGMATIRHVGGKQILTLSRTPDLTGELEHYQHDTFIVRWKERNFNADAYVTFALNPDGSIERMKMQPISTETDFSYDFQDLNFTPVKQIGRLS